MASLSDVKGLDKVHIFIADLDHISFHLCLLQTCLSAPLKLAGKNVLSAYGLASGSSRHTH